MGNQGLRTLHLPSSDQGVKAAAVRSGSTVLTVPSDGSEHGATWQLLSTQACRRQGSRLRPYVARVSCALYTA